MTSWFLYEKMRTSNILFSWHNWRVGSVTTDLNEKQYLSPFQLTMSDEKEMDFGYTPPFYSLNFEIKMNKDKLRRHTG